MRRAKTPSVEEFNETALQQFISDRPDGDFQLGYLAACIEFSKMFGIEEDATLSMAIALLQSLRGADA